MSAHAAGSDLQHIRSSESLWLVVAKDKGSALNCGLNLSGGGLKHTHHLQCSQAWVSKQHALNTGLAETASHYAGCQHWSVTLLSVCGNSLDLGTQRVVIMICARALPKVHHSQLLS